jgi:hypothetical protein
VKEAAEQVAQTAYESELFEAVQRTIDKCVDGESLRKDLAAVAQETYVAKIQKAAKALLDETLSPEEKTKIFDDTLKSMELLHLKHMVMYTQDNVDALLPGLAHRFVKGYKNEPRPESPRIAREDPALLEKS